MNQKTKLLTLALLLLASTATAQRVTVLELPNGQHVGIYYPATGNPILLQNVTVVKFPNPTPPPATATHAIVILESGDTSIETTILKAQIRQDEKLTRLVQILDPDTEDENGNPDPSVVKAKVLVGNRPFPFVIGFDGGGKAVVAEPLPLEFANLKALLQKWGM